MCGLTVFVSLIAQDGPETVVRGTKQFRQSEVVTGLAGPFEVTWGPDNMLWVTEQTGKRITRVNPATGEKKVAVTIDEVSRAGRAGRADGTGARPGQQLRLHGLHIHRQEFAAARDAGCHEPVSFSLHEDRALYLRPGEGDAGQSGHAHRGNARGQRPYGRADEDRAGSQAVLHDRRPGERSARQLLRSDRSRSGCRRRRKSRRRTTPRTWESRCG